MNHYNGFLEVADTIDSLPPILTKETPKALEAYCREHNIEMAAQKDIQRISVQPDWLEKAAEIYNISTNLSDYITVPVIFMASDLPNRNLTAFPLDELSKFSPKVGNLVYRGWTTKPIYVDHSNLVYDKAIGSIVDMSMKKMETARHDIYKVIGLLAIDATKGPIPQDILSGRRTHYSMGAYVEAYSCSVCGGKGHMTSSMKNKFECLPCGKQHVKFDRDGKMTTYPSQDGKNKVLAFVNAHDIMPFEISSVPTPAFVSATTTADQIASF
jgi:hypothetical protein